MNMPVNSDSPSRGILLLYLGVTLLSFNGIFSKLIPLDAFSITQLRSLVAVGGFYLVCRTCKVSLRVSSPLDLAGIYGLGLVMGLHWGTFFHAMQISSVAVGILALFSYPMITVLLEPVFSRRRLALRDIVSGLLVLVGLLIMVWQDLLLGVSGQIVTGAAWGVLSALLFALRNLTQKYFFKAIPSGTLMFHQLTAVTLLFVPFVDFSAANRLTLNGWVLVVLLGLLGTAAAHTLYSASLKRLDAKTVSLIGCLQPVVTILLAWAILHEVPSLSVVFGGAIILFVAMLESGLRR